MIAATRTDVDDMFKDSAEEDNNHHAFDGVFDVDDLLETQTLNESIDEFGNSNDFSMSASGVGEDEFGVFECEPNSSMIGSTSHHDSFACNSPTSPRLSANFSSALSNFGNESSSLTADDVYIEAAPPSDDHYISFSDIPSEEGSNQKAVKSPIRHVTANYHDLISSMNTTDDIPTRHQSGQSYNSVNRSHSSEMFSPSQGILDEINESSQHVALSPSIIHPQTVHQDNQPQHYNLQNENFQVNNPQVVHMNSQNQQQRQFHPTPQQHEPIQIIGTQHSQFTYDMNSYHNQKQQQQQQPFPGFQGNPHANISNPPHGGAYSITSQATLNNSSHGGNFQYNTQNTPRDLSQDVFRSRSQGITSISSHGGSFQPSAQPLTSNSYHGIPYRKTEHMMMNSSSHFPASASSLNSHSHDAMQRRNSSPFSKTSYGSNASFAGMQNNVAIPQERHSPQKYFSGFESQSQSPSSMKNPSANMNEVMEKLTERMRQSAMSRNMVKHISGRSLVSQSSSRGLLVSQGSSRGVGQIPGLMMPHSSAKSMMKQGSERSVGDTVRATPIRRVSSNAKHQLPGRSLHRQDSHRSLNHSNHGTISLQIDGRNVGNF